MIEAVVVVMVVALVVVALAAGVIGGLAVSRRPVDEWTEHLREQGAEPVATDEGPAVTPRAVSLDDMLMARARRGSAYLDPSDIPGYEHIEEAADRLAHVQVRPPARSVRRPDPRRA